MCARCATNKAGKRSCCARGGAWFKKCGDVGGTQFDHTWVEGMQACKSVMLPVESPVSHHVEDLRVIVFPLRTAQPQNSTQLEGEIFRPVMSMSNVGSTDSKDGLGKIVVCIFGLFIIVNLRTSLTDSR